MKGASGRFLPKEPETQVPPDRGCATITGMASGMDSTRQQTFTIIGSVAGTVLAATIAIATLIVLQHDTMRRSLSAEIESVRSTLSAEIESVRGELSAEIESLRGTLSAEIASVHNASSSEIAALRGDVVEIRDDVREIRSDIREMRSDISDLRERMARVEVHVGVPAENR